MKDIIGKPEDSQAQKQTYYSNLTFKVGVSYWEIECPISCSGLEFGVQNKHTLEQFVGTFRTTTPRTVGVKLDFVNNKLDFYLNGREQPKRSKLIKPGEYFMIVNVKN